MTSVEIPAWQPLTGPTYTLADNEYPVLLTDDDTADPPSTQVDPSEPPRGLRARIEDHAADPPSTPVDPWEAERRLGDLWEKASAPPRIPDPRHDGRHGL